MTPWADLVRLLRCPTCRSELALAPSLDTLYCTTHRFPIRGEVPVLLADNVATGTKSTFDFKWNHLPRYGYDRATEWFRREWYLGRYGWTGRSLSLFLSGCELVLDVGTGLGSQVAMYADKNHGAKGLVFGIDTSESVFQARKRLRRISNALFVQADLHQMPFAEETFDFVVADQVLHHTPDTKKAFQALVPMVKPGGQLAFYVYRKKSETRERCDDLLRGYTTKLTEDECLLFAKAVTEFGRDLSKLNLGLQRAVYWDVLKCFWNQDFDLKTNVMINFDWYHPKFAWRHTVEEVESWVREAGLTVLHVDKESRSGVSVRARK